MAVLDDDGPGAYKRERDRIRELLGHGGQPRPPVDDPPSLAVAIEELRDLLRDFDSVELAAMSDHFHVHANNELDLAGRTIIDAFDRERRPPHDARGQ